MSCAHLSFNSTGQLTNLKNTLPLWEDMVSKTMKLNASLRSVIHCVAGFLEAFQKIADAAYSSNCGLRELGSSMTRFCLRERGLESRLRTFNSQLLDCLATPLTDRLEEWRRTVIQLDRENSKEWRRARNELQRVTGEFDKLNRRFRRKTSVPNQAGSVEDESGQTGDNMQLNFVQHDLHLKQQTLADLERSTLKRAVVEERRRFAELITCLKPVLDAQSAMFSDVDSIDECIRAISTYTCDPNHLPPDTEQAVEEAVKNVSARSQGPTERRFSDVRAAMRFGRNPFADFARPSLSAHTSQLSLRSARSSTTTTTPSATAAMQEIDNHRCVSPALNGIYADPHKQCPVSPGHLSVTHSNGFNHHGDAYSLFEHTDSHVADSVSLGPSVCTNGSINGNYSSLDHANKPSTDRAAVASGFETTYIPLNDIRPMDDFEDDGEEDDGGGATTEDTEDGETDDDPSGDSLSRDLDKDAKSQPMLYPNQAIPAPVYTNLHELKRAAARKFGNTEIDSHANAETSSLEAIRGQPDSPKESTTPNSFTDVPTTSSSSIRPTAGGGGVGDGYITTQINCGTSTFRRRQSEYDKRKPINGRNCGYPTSTAASRLVQHPQVHPDVVNGGGGGGGRVRNRPTQPPPRRSSSMNRDHTSSQQRYSSMDPYTAYPPLNHPQHSHANGIESGIQRVSSSIFTQNDHQMANWPTVEADGTHRSRADHLYHHHHQPTQYASVSTTNHGPPLHPPPLATVQAPTFSKTNQLMMGVKVLPNHSPPIVPGWNGANGGGRALRPAMQRQASCEPRLKSTHVPPPTIGGSPALNHHRAAAHWSPSQPVMMGMPTNPPQPVHTRCQDDTSTSFID